MNDENLRRGNPDTQFRSGREAVENGRKGGRVSGVSRSFKAALKRRLKEHPEQRDSLIDMLWAKALLEHDLKAAEMLLELSEERETDLDKKIKRAKYEKLKAETEALRRSMADGSGDETERRSLADALQASAAAIWEGTDNET